MILTRRRAVQLLGGLASAATLRPAFATGSRLPQPQGVEVSPGHYSATRASLQGYTVPNWFADAKFGIWSHWGPQSAVGDGDWYARNMYMEDTPQYKYHVKRFGPQSKTGYKDLIPLFTADKWDPEHLMDLYAGAGAKYFFSMGVHHDNYDLWNSKYQPRWNSVSSGPHKDIVGLWASAARRRGLRFGVSEHLSNSFDWLSSSHSSDTKGPLAGVPYDGADPAFADLYHDYSGLPADWPRRFLGPHQGMSREAPDRWKLQYYNRVKDLVDQHQPDLLYTDGGIPFEEYGLATVAELYNVGPLDNHGLAETVYFSKSLKDCAIGTCALDRERQVADSISPNPWQTDTCIGGWHYKVGQVYKTPKKVVDMLVDIISKNGNLLLNFPLPASGELDPEELKTLDGITQWMRVNGEAVFATRPWTVNGEGPAMAVVLPTVEGFNPNESKKPDLGALDVRYTTKGKTLYAFVQGWPGAQLSLKLLGTASAQKPGKVLAVTLLGRDQNLKFEQAPDGLRVSLPAEKPSTADIGIALKVRFA